MHTNQGMSMDPPLKKPLPIGREQLTCDGPGCSKKGPAKRCSRCQTSFYCSAKCQKEHWKNGHKQYCINFQELEESEELKMDERRKEFVRRWESHLALQYGPGVIETSSNTSCAICLSDDMVDPFTLPTCGHTFCFVCLQNWQKVKQSNISWTEGEIIREQPKCPKCRADSPDIISFILQMGHIHTTRAFILGLSKAKRRREFELALKELEKLERTGVLETVPKKKLLVLTKKGEVLMRLERWVEALKVNEVCDALHEEGRNNKGQMQKRLNDLNCAGAEGRYEDSMEIIWELKGKVADDPLLSSIDTSIFRLYFCIVKCKEEIGDYRGALVFYKYKIGPAMKHMIKQKGHTSELHEKNFHMNMGLAKCMYHLGEYRHSIGAGLHAVKHDRSFRQVHKYVALSFRATGNPEAAIQFMAMAINYEIPWDEENRQVNLKLYEEMIRDASKKKI